MGVEKERKEMQKRGERDSVWPTYICAAGSAPLLKRGVVSD